MVEENIKMGDGVALNIFRSDGKNIFEDKLEPSIYSFYSEEFNAINNFYSVKFGDTKRDVLVRLNEWRDNSGIYKNLIQLSENPAYFTTTDGVKIYFRDKSLHKYLENNGFIKAVELGAKPLDNEKISIEFYSKRDAEGNYINFNENVREIINDAYNDIKDKYGLPSSEYTYYDSIRGQKSRSHYTPTHDFKLRKFQSTVVDSISDYFIKNKAAPNSKFLLTAPTRSGKSFMAANVADRICKDSVREHNLVVVVSGFAEISDEWKKTFESHKLFNQKEYNGVHNKCGEVKCTCESNFVYLNKDDLVSNLNAVEEAYQNGAKNVVVFLTLQDLAGSTTGRKNENFRAHDFLKSEEITLLLIDEAHYSSFNEDGVYSRALMDENSPLPITDEVEDGDPLEKNDTAISQEDKVRGGELLGSLKSIYGKLYITATPYNVISEGHFFDLDSNVIIITEKQVAVEKEEWDEANLYEESPYNEWDNPCYGIPVKKYFGIKLGMSPNELFKVTSTKSPNAKFVHEKLVKDIIKSMFGLGDKAPNIFANSDYERAGLGNHVYITLPTCAACDALEKLLKELFDGGAGETDALNFDGDEEFSNDDSTATIKDDSLTHLKNTYEIFNISSISKSHPITKKSSTEIKELISNAFGKTLTLTVDRMGTGVTVEEWDTVMLFRSLRSAQKFTQVTGRCGTPWVSSHESSDGEIFKVLEKPNSAIITLDPALMLSVKYNKASVLSANSNGGKITGGGQYEKLEEEFEVNETFTVDLNSGGGVEKITASNIIEKVLEHNRDKGVRELSDILTINEDSYASNENFYKLMDKVTSLGGRRLNSLNAFDDFNSLFEDGCMALDEETDEACGGEIIEGPDKRFFAYCAKHYTIMVKAAKDFEEFKKNGTPLKSTESVGGGELIENTDGGALFDLPDVVDDPEDSKIIDKNLKDKVKTVYSLVLLVAALTSVRVRGLSEFVVAVREDERTGEIAKHFNLNVKLLEVMDAIGVSNFDLDESIQLMNKSLEHVDEANKWDSFSILLNSFGRFSANEIPTPKYVSGLLIDTLIDNWTAPSAGGVKPIIGDTVSENTTFKKVRDSHVLMASEEELSNGISSAISSKVNDVLFNVNYSDDYDGDSVGSLFNVSISENISGGAPDSSNSIVSVPEDSVETVSSVEVVGGLNKLNAGGDSVGVKSLEFFRDFEENNRTLIDVGCKSAVILVDFYERAVAAGVSHESLRDKLYCVPTSSSTYELCRKVYEVFDWDVSNIYYFDGVGNMDVLYLLILGMEYRNFEYTLDGGFMLGDGKSSKKFREDSDNLRRIFGSITDIGVRGALENFWKECLVMESFDYAVGNPPYQKEVGVRDNGQWHFATIYDDFQKIASKISVSTSMIYPAGWQNSINQGFGKWLRENGLKTSKFYWAYQVFGNAIRADYPITIVSTERNYMGRININGLSIKRDINVWLDNELKKIVYEKVCSNSKKLVCGATHISHLNNIDSFPKIEFKKESNDSTDVKIYIKKSTTTAADGGDYFISQNDALNNFSMEDINEYIVATQWGIFIQNRAFMELAQKPEKGLSLKTFDKNYVFGKTWVKLKSFKTPEEAKNFTKYMNVKIIVIASTFEKSMKNFASYVPDLEDYTNNNPIFKTDEELGEVHEYHGLTLDERLYKLFNLTEEEIEVIKSEK